MENIEELKKEIDILTEKVEELERKEHQRKVLSYVRFLIKLALIMFTIYGFFQLYDYLINEVPKILQEKIVEVLPQNLRP